MSYRRRIGFAWYIFMISAFLGVLIAFCVATGTEHLPQVGEPEVVYGGYEIEHSDLGLPLQPDSHHNNPYKPLSFGCGSFYPSWGYIDLESREKHMEEIRREAIEKAKTRGLILR